MRDNKPQLLPYMEISRFFSTHEFLSGFHFYILTQSSATIFSTPSAETTKLAAVGGLG